MRDPRDSNDLGAEEGEQEAPSKLLSRAEAAIEIRDEFLSLASHELRTPLTPLRLALESLQRRLGRPAFDPARAMREVEQSLQQVQRMTTLVDRMLDVTRIATGTLSLDRSPSDLLPVVKRVVDGFEAPASRVECSIELAAEVDRLEGSWDAFRLEQVFVNLVSNALKYAPGGPIRVNVSLGSSAEGARARVAIADSGKGIPEAQRSTIFERFVRAADGTKKDGLGLGLFLSRNIVEAHRGTLTVESELGRGSTFVVELPTS